MALLVMGFWLALNGRIAADTLLVGAAVTALLLVLGHFSSLWSFRRELCIYKLIPGGILYLFALLWQIFLANMQVIGLIVTHGEKPCIRHYTTALKTKAARAVLANSITLTPGTVTVQLIGDVLTVHCLTEKLANALDGSTLEKRLLKMEERMHG